MGGLEISNKRGNYGIFIEQNKIAITPAKIYSIFFYQYSISADETTGVNWLLQGVS
jgi:hypothetical protein